ncbi:MAG: hypothetical protein ACLFP8_09185 [Alphaproteobacteria bacterium]
MGKEKRPGNKKKCFVLDIYFSEIIAKDGIEVSEEERGLTKKAIIKHWHRPGECEVDFYE